MVLNTNAPAPRVIIILTIFTPAPNGNGCVNNSTKSSIIRPSDKGFYKKRSGIWRGSWWYASWQQQGCFLGGQGWWRLGRRWGFKCWWWGKYLNYRVFYNFYLTKIRAHIPIFTFFIHRLLPVSQITLYSLLQARVYDSVAKKLWTKNFDSI